MTAATVTAPLLSSLLPLPHLSSDKMMAILSSMYSALYGNPKAFIPKWFMFGSSDYFMPYKWTYLYDTTPLKETLNKSIDFTKLKRGKSSDVEDKEYSRLIITSTDIQKAEPVIFDTAHMDIDVDKIIACVGYPFYGVRWIEKDGRYLCNARGDKAITNKRQEILHCRCLSTSTKRASREYGRSLA
jgi:NTE family protein